MAHLHITYGHIYNYKDINVVTSYAKSKHSWHAYIRVAGALVAVYKTDTRVLDSIDYLYVTAYNNAGLPEHIGKEIVQEERDAIIKAHKQ